MNDYEKTMCFSTPVQEVTLCSTRKETKYSQNPHYIYNQVICYGLTKCQQTREFSPPVSLTGRQQRAVTKKGVITLLFIFKSNLKRITNLNFYVKISHLLQNLRLHIYSSAIFNKSYQEAKGKNAYKKSILTSPASVRATSANAATVLVP